MEDVLKRINEQEKLLKDYQDKFEVYDTEIRTLRSKYET